MNTRRFSILLYTDKNWDGRKTDYFNDKKWEIIGLIAQKLKNYYLFIVAGLFTHIEKCAILSQRHLKLNIKTA